MIATPRIIWNGFASTKTAPKSAFFVFSMRVVTRDGSRKSGRFKNVELISTWLTPIILGRLRHRLISRGLGGVGGRLGSISRRHLSISFFLEIRTGPIGEGNPVLFEFLNFIFPLFKDFFKVKVLLGADRLQRVESRLELHLRALGLCDRVDPPARHARPVGARIGFAIIYEVRGALRKWEGIPIKGLLDETLADWISKTHGKVIFPPRHGLPSLKDR